MTIRNAALSMALCVGLTPTSVRAEDKIPDYVGSFTTEVLYKLCTQESQEARQKCDLYLQGLLSGLDISKTMQVNNMQLCLPKMTSEDARVKVVSFINGITGGRPSSNKDGGDWMAFMGVSVGHMGDVCNR
jgi:hypothetical protein